MRARISTPPAVPVRGLLSGARRFLALTPAERRAWRRAWWQLLRSDLALRWRPARTLSRALAAPAPGLRDGAEGVESVARAVASAAAHHLGPMRCLPRAVALRELLEARGVGARVRIGVRRQGSLLAAHAWVEVGGRAVGEIEPLEERFLPLVQGRSEP